CFLCPSACGASGSVASGSGSLVAPPSRYLLDDLARHSATLGATRLGATRGHWCVNVLDQPAKHRTVSTQQPAPADTYPSAGPGGHVSFRAPRQKSVGVGHSPGASSPCVCAARGALCRVHPRWAAAYGL